MSAKLEFFADRFGRDSVTHLFLGEVEIPEPGLQSVQVGEEIQLWAQNTGTTVLEEISLKVDGEAAPVVELARDNNDEPYRWLVSDVPITPVQRLTPGSKFSFWTRAVYGPLNSEGTKTFFINVSALST